MGYTAISDTEKQPDLKNKLKSAVVEPARDLLDVAIPIDIKKDIQNLAENLPEHGYTHTRIIPGGGKEERTECRASKGRGLRRSQLPLGALGKSIKKIVTEEGGKTYDDERPALRDINTLGEAIIKLYDLRWINLNNHETTPDGIPSGVSAGLTPVPDGEDREQAILEATYTNSKTTLQEIPGTFWKFVLFNDPEKAYIKRMFNNYSWADSLPDEEKRPAKYAITAGGKFEKTWASALPKGFLTRVLGRGGGARTKGSFLRSKKRTKKRSNKKRTRMKRTRMKRTRMKRTRMKRSNKKRTRRSRRSRRS
jgi:hypothetical protein